MEKRVLLAVVLSFLVLYGFQALFKVPEPPKPGPDQSQPTPAAVGPQDSSTPAQTSPSAPQPGAPPEPSAAPLVADTSDREIVVEGDSVRATFSSRGAVLKSWRLKKYQNHHGQDLELVPQDVPPDAARPFTLSVDDAAVSASLARALFRPSAPSLALGSDPATLSFVYSDASGLTAEKRFTFNPRSPYIVEVLASVTKGGSTLVPAIQWGPALGTALDASAAGYYNMPPRAVVHQGSEERYDAKKIGEIANVEGAYEFAGVDDHYFMVAAVTLKEPVRLHYETLQLPLREGAEKPPPPYVSWSVRTTNGGSNVAFFMGPKDYDVLRAIDPNLTRAIDFGIFAWLVVPLLRSLKWVNGYVGNYGWSIVLLTVLINLVMFPLRHKSVVSMRRMQEIQPEIKSIQDRYAKLKITDPARQKMNTEMMALYKERGVNPASGCVPMLLTLPVLFAFYAMLSVAIELRGAPFFGWIKDLSIHDPLYITPVLMGLTQFIQTKMTPSTADPTQQRIMLLMPLMFMGMFLWAPSGLVLYWTVSNIWAIGQQAITQRLIGPQQQRTVRPPAERQLKTVGARATDQAAKERKSMELHERVREFTRQTMAAMGLTLEVEVKDTPDAIRVEIGGEGGEYLLRRRAEALDALQLIVNTAFRRELNDDRSFVVDCLDYRKAKDEELRQMARFLMEKAKSSGPQEMGPLNPYARRIVHLTVAEDPVLSSESIGDAHMKTVIISQRR